jgi:predicted nucleic acid-binding protein
MPQDAIALLQRFVALPGHHFWHDDVALADSPAIARDRLIGYRQITDAQLLALAIVRGGRLVTFDRGIVELVPADFAAASPVQVLNA